jgi:hypothetical protein
MNGRPFARNPPWSHEPFNEHAEGVPPANWEQHPEQYPRRLAAVVRWGDVALFNQPAVPAGPVTTNPISQFAEFWLKLPAVCMVRLSCLVKQGVVNAADLVTWKLLIGVGSSTSTKFFQSIPDPNTGATNHDLLLTLPLEHLTVQATLVCKADPAVSRSFELVAQIAPFTSYEGLVAV